MLLDAFDSNWIAPLGPHVDAFEEELASMVAVSHAAALSSGTAGLHLALRLLGVGPGDDVMTATMTFVATANAIAYLSARPVLVDCDADTWQISPDLVADELAIRARRGRLPRALVTVDLYGQCADHDRLREACAPYGIPIVEDAAEALGATYRGRAAGGLGDVGVFSFNGNKILTTSGGGMLVSDDGALVARARFLASQARDPAPHYEHSTIGYNYRLSNLLAAVGRAQLQTLPQRVARRRATNAAYREALASTPGVTFMPEAPYGRSNAWLTCATIDTADFGASRDDVIDALARRDIESRPTWKPLHLQPVFRDAPVVGGAVAASVFRGGICLPSGSSLTESQLERVTAGVLAAVGEGAMIA